MDYTKIKDNTLLIIPNNIKEYILKELNKTNKLVNIKIMSLNELVKKYTFDYDNNTIIYLVEKYGIKVDIALTYIKNMYYVEDKIYKSDKLNNLNKLKKELISNNLLIYDDLFNNMLKQKHIVIYGYDYIDKYTSSIINKIKNITDVEIIEKQRKNNNLVVNQFDNIDEEIEFVATKIIELINNSVDIKKIKLANISSEYEHSLTNIFKFYNIPINLNKQVSIYETKIGNKFINYCKNSNFNDAVEKLKNETNINDEETCEIINKIIDICNSYDTNIINENTHKCLIHSLKNTKIRSKNLENAVEIIDLKDNVITDDLYIFLLGFNQGTIPNIYKDEDYISDNLKDEINIETTLEKNIKEKEIITNIIKSIKNLCITYKLKTPFETYYPSGLINELNIEVVKPSIDIKNGYSNTYNKIKLTSKLDKLVKFNKIDEDLGIFYNTYKDIDYLTYDNKFSKIDSYELNDYLNNKLLLSYSSIDKFYRCKFRYYINNILKLEKFEDTFPIFIGNMFHYILSICFNHDFNFDDEWDKYLGDKELTNKEKFFMKKLKNELLFIIDTIKEQEKLSNLKNKLYEEKIYINKDKNIKITFMGIVDKLMYEEVNGQTIVAIIDYKTGNPETNLNNTIYGIEMQLPVYLYLVKNSNKFSNVKVAGFYLQKILNNEVMVKPLEDLEKVKKNNLKLQGYSNSNEEILKEFDFSYKDSEMIKSMKMSSKGFYSYAKVINDEAIDKLIDIVDKKIDTAINEILDGNFEINPKRIGNKNIGCEFCKFKDLCFMNEKDIVNLKEYRDLEFLGSDTNA